MEEKIIKAHNHVCHLTNHECFFIPKRVGYNNMVLDDNGKWYLNFLSGHPQQTCFDVLNEGSVEIPNI
jgi:hypothetical protein